MYHPLVGKVCLAVGKHMVTASRITKELEAFDCEAKDKNLIFLNEIGLDPGLDIIFTLNTIEKIEADHGE